MIHVKNVKKKLREVCNIEWGILIILLFIPFVSFCYMDTKSIIHYQINFVDAFRQGEIGNFYQFCYDKVQYYLQQRIPGSHYATYDFPMYIVLGIWGIPLYVYCTLAGVEVTDSMIGLIYGKSIYIVAIIFSSIVLYRICLSLKIDRERAKYCPFLFCSSTLIYSSICIMGQSDIIGIVFLLLGIYAYINKNEKMFLLWFTIAIPFKVFALFIFIPLLLLEEKNIFRIGIKGSVAVSFMLVSNMIFQDDSLAMAEKTRFSQQMLDKLLGNKLPILNSSIPTVMVGFLIICVLCYLHKKDKEFYEYAVFVPLVTILFLFISFDSYPYWFIYIAPMVAIASVYNWKNFDNLLLFETVGLIALLLAQYMQYAWCFDVQNGEGMLLWKLLNGSDVVEWTYLEQVVTKISFNYMKILYALYVVCMLTIIYISRPSELQQCTNRKYEIENISLKIRTRMMINASVAYVPIVWLLYNYLRG